MPNRLWLGLFLPALVLAQSPVDAKIAAAQSAGDNAWMLTCAALVLMMTGPGLALFYGGLVRRKNVLGTMMHSFLLMAVIAVLWAVVGYSLGFGEGWRAIGDLRSAFLNTVGEPQNAAGLRKTPRCRTPPRRAP